MLVPYSGLLPRTQFTSPIFRSSVVDPLSLVVIDRVPLFLTAGFASPKVAEPCTKGAFEIPVPGSIIPAFIKGESPYHQRLPAKT
jgi:hypothetical protein